MTRAAAPWSRHNGRPMAAELLPIRWVDIPRGSVERGTPAEEIDWVVARHCDLKLPRHFFVKEAPREMVAVDPFRISLTPVTNAIWQLFSERTGRAFALSAPADHPVSDRSWDEAVDFCAWASEVTGLPIRLHAEFEWERAARGDDAREYPWGNAFDARRANLAELGIGTTIQAGALPAGASPFGVLDMAGNVDEWTSTVYAPYPGAPPEVPQVEGWASNPHVTRGGGFRHHRDLARCARRHALYPPAAGAGVRLVTAVTP